MKNWDYISVKLTTTGIETKPTHKIKITVVYGPNEDDTKENKDLFWQTLKDIKKSTSITTLIFQLSTSTIKTDVRFVW